MLTDFPLALDTVWHHKGIWENKDDWIGRYEMMAFDMPAEFLPGFVGDVIGNVDELGNILAQNQPVKEFRDVLETLEVTLRDTDKLINFWLSMVAGESVKLPVSSGPLNTVWRREDYSDDVVALWAHMIARYAKGQVRLNAIKWLEGWRERQGEANIFQLSDTHPLHRLIGTTYELLYRGFLQGDVLARDTLICMADYSIWGLAYMHYYHWLFVKTVGYTDGDHLIADAKAATLSFGLHNPDKDEPYTIGPLSYMGHFPAAEEKPLLRCEPPGPYRK